MKRIVLLSLLLISSLSCYAQIIEVSGRITSPEDGSALPGVNVVIKGTSQGTVTDINGKYAIQAPVGSVLVFSFVGLATREMLVTPDLAKKRPTVQEHESTPEPLLSPFKNDVADTSGVRFTDQTPVYRAHRNFPSQIKEIRQAQGNKNKMIISNLGNYVTLGDNLQATLSFTFDHGRAFRLPRRQSTYAQGRTDGTQLTWFGPDQNEIYSWGPQIRLLEFADATYPYDQNGPLVPVNTGSGRPGISYNPYDFIQSANRFSEKIALALYQPEYTLGLNFSNSKFQDIYPGTEKKNTFGEITINNIDLGSIKLNGVANFRQLRGTGWNHGSNLTRIMGSMVTSPISFDPSNNSDNSTTAYRLPDGSIRSYAPEIASNPYGILAEASDNDRIQYVKGFLQANYRNDYSNDLDISAAVNATYDHSNNRSEFSIPVDYPISQAGTRTNRLRSYDHLSSGANFSIGTDKLVENLNIKTSLLFNYFDYKFSRVDQLSDNSEIILDNQLFRSTVEPLVQLNLEHAGLVFKPAISGYHSSTLSEDKSFYFLPSGHISYNILNGISWRTNLTINAIYSRGISEADLIYEDWSYNSLALNADRYQDFYQTSEVFFTPGLKPMLTEEFSTGIEFNTGQFSLDASYYTKTRYDYILPLPSGDQYINAADIRDNGLEITAEVYDYNPGLTYSLTFSRIRSIVKRTDNNEVLPIAGFSDVFVGLEEEESWGSIYGSSYERRDGNILIDTNGFPRVATEVKRVGSVLPEWTMGFHVGWQHNGFNIGMTWDYRHGGDIWNGTAAFMDYHGTSEKTGTERNISNYVFEGVTEDGLINTTPVSFYDPSMPIEANRWVRYGLAGVTEEYIEDGSTLRLSSLNISYEFNTRDIDLINGIKVSLSGSNLVFWSRYSGSDPMSTLYGYQLGQGLDLFNQPVRRTFSANITIYL